MAQATHINDKIKVLGLVSYNFLPAKMGGQKAIALFYQFFSKHASFVCVTTKNNQPGAAEYEVLNILSNAPLRYINIFYFFTLKRIIQRRGITHLQIEHPYYGWLALLLRCFCGVRIILHSHNIEGERFRSLGKSWASVLLWYERKIHRAADYVFYITGEDMQYAINKFGVSPGKCLVTPYGINLAAPPTPAEKMECRAIIEKKHQVPARATVLLLNGAFDYKPNLAALQFVIDKLNPLLAGRPGLSYRIIICGKNIPANILSGKYPNIDIAGFVDDIELYLKGSDIFLNPIAGGGGIKTKLVEALAYNLTAISFADGAIGIPVELTGSKLIVMPGNKDGVAMAFVEAVETWYLNPGLNIPVEYFLYFNAGAIAKKAVEFISAR